MLTRNEWIGLGLLGAFFYFASKKSPGVQVPKASVTLGTPTISSTSGGFVTPDAQDYLTTPPLISPQTNLPPTTDYKGDPTTFIA